MPGASSQWKVLSSGVPQGSILGPLFFLIFINDIVSDIACNIRLFADDTSMYLVVENPNIAAATLQSDIDKVSNWADKWHVDFNPSKSKCLLISKQSGVNPTLHSTRTVFKYHLPLITNI